MSTESLLKAYVLGVEISNFWHQRLSAWSTTTQEKTHTTDTYFRLSLEWYNLKLVHTHYFKFGMR